MNKPLISVIVPVYNAEKTLGRCVESIQNQSWTNLEILLINDGSSDRSDAMCREFAHRDKRIVYIEQKNSGVSAARNAGLDVMRGEYCCFLDADDWMDAEHIASMGNAMTDTECIIVGYTKDIGKKQDHCALTYGEFDMNRLENSEIADMFVNGYIHPCWNKLFLSDLIRQHQIRFRTGLHISEDSIFCLEYLMHCDTMHILNETGYHYAIDVDTESLSKKVYPESLDIYHEVYLLMEKLLDRGNMPAELQNYILVQTIFPQVYNVMIKAVCSETLPEKQRKQIFCQGSELEYCCLVLREGMKASASFAEKFCVGLILFKQYRVFSMVMKWLRGK